MLLHLDSSQVFYSSHPLFWLYRCNSLAVQTSNTDMFFCEPAVLFKLLPFVHSFCSIVAYEGRFHKDILKITTVLVGMSHSVTVDINMLMLHIFTNLRKKTFKICRTIYTQGPVNCFFISSSNQISSFVNCRSSYFPIFSVLLDHLSYVVLKQVQ